MKGKLFTVTGPSGAGKDSVIERAKEMGFTFGEITTMSTRPMRPGESEANPYYFVTQDEFEEKIENGEMIEYAEVYGNYYGSTKQEVQRAIEADPVVLMTVDPQGARTFKDMMKEDVVTIFIQPPSVDALRERLENRASDSQEVIEVRLQVAQEELMHLDEWDYVVPNDKGKLDEAAQHLIDIVKQETR